VVDDDVGIRGAMSEPAQASSNPFQPSLRAREGWLLGMEIASLAQARLPLAEGLRVAAAETPSRRLAAAMRGLAGNLERGVALDQALAQSTARLPQHFLALVAAGLRTGALARVLQDFVEYRRRVAYEWNSIRRVLAYPLVILALAALLFVFVTLWIVPQVSTVLYEFDVDLPRSTRLMVWLSEDGLAWVAGGAIALAGLLLAVRWLHGTRLVHALVGGIPILGTMWRLGSWSQFSYLMALLLENGVPLPDALRLTSDAVQDDRLARATRVLAERCGQGSRMTEALAGIHALPATLAPVVQWGEERSALAAAFRAAAEMFSARLELQAQLVRVVSVPVTFLIVAGFVLFTVGAMFGPFIALITNLSK
jgi:general secretion pathway protein F